MEGALVQLEEDLIGYGLVVMTTIPGSHIDPESIPLGLLVPPPPRGGVVFEHGIPLRTACRCTVRVPQGDPLHAEASSALKKWITRNRARWWLPDDRWREVAFLSGHHATTHVDRRMELARMRDRHARATMEAHQREVDRLLGALEANK